MRRPCAATNLGAKLLLEKKPHDAPAWTYNRGVLAQLKKRFRRWQPAPEIHEESNSRPFGIDFLLRLCYRSGT
jgi:hypothetical protein